MSGVDYLTFFHSYYESSNHHTFKGSLIRHITIERILYRLKAFALSFPRPLSTVLLFPLTILFGLNCNFPIRDVLQWSLYMLFFERILSRQIEEYLSNEAYERDCERLFSMMK